MNCNVLDVLKEVTATLTGPDQIFEIQESEICGRMMKTWVNAPSSLREVWLASVNHGDNEYLIFQDERWTYGDAHEAVSRIANWLVSNGVNQHDRVAIAMRNYPEWLLSYWAIVSIGAVAVGMNAWWAADELKYGLRDSCVKVLICDEERLSMFGEFQQEFKDLQVVAVRENELPKWAIPWSNVLNAAPLMPEVDIDPDDDTCIFYTSGTTGSPKGAQLTHRSCVNQLMSSLFGAQSQMNAIALLNGEELPDPADSNLNPLIGLVAMPLFHVGANNCMAQVYTVVGGKLVLMHKWDAGEALRLIESEKITNFAGAPAMGRDLIGHREFNIRDLSSMGALGCGGAPVPPDLIEKIDGNGVQVIPTQGYGLTETSGLVTVSCGIFLTSRPTSAGVLLPVCEIKTIDENGQDLPEGEKGEICLYGPHIIKGYLNQPEATADGIVQGWLRTGDIGFVDKDGFVYLVDRAKDMVLRGGENVYCAEVEAAMYNYPGVGECAVFPVSDIRLGEEVGAAIFLTNEAKINTDELRCFLKATLAAFKVPRYIWLLHEPLPRNAAGKFLKRNLRKTLDISNAT